MLWRIFRGLCMNPAGRTLVAGTIGVLAGVECLLSSRSQARLRERAHQPPVKAPAVSTRADYLKIYRTKSELGYVYWVLQGFGRYKCFVLLDSWREAIAEAEQRARGESVSDDQLVTAGSHT